MGSKEGEKTIPCRARVTEINVFRCRGEPVEESDGGYRGSKIPCAGMGFRTSYGGNRIVEFAAVPDPTDPGGTSVPAPSAPPLPENQENEEGLAVDHAGKEEPTPRKEVSEGAVKTPRGSEKSERIGIGPEFYRMSAQDKFNTLKDYVDCLMYQFKSLTDVLPPDQLAFKVISKKKKKKKKILPSTGPYCGYKAPRKFLRPQII